jgi:integrase
VDIHPDLLDELLEYKMSLGDRWQAESPAFRSSRGTRRDRHGISRWIIAPAVAAANGGREKQGLPPIGQHVTPHTFRYTYMALTLFAGASVRYVADQVGHEDVLTTQRIYAYVLRRLERGDVGRKRQLLRARVRDSTSSADATIQNPGALTVTATG